MIEKTKENTSFIVNETSKPNSFECGKAGNRFKLYFNTPDDLKNQIDELKKIGIYKEDE